MPFYVRKTVSAGPFRFNFSKGGVGVSVGVKGLRIGTGPRGHYIHAGSGGLYYRATLGNAGRNQRRLAPQPASPSPQVIIENDDVAMIEIESGDVMHMQDESFSELLNEINSKAAQTRMSAALAWTAIVIGALVGFATGGAGLLLCFLALPGWAIGNWFDSYRRTTVLYYDLEGEAETAYNRLAEAFGGLNGCAAKWHIEAGGAVQSLRAWKRNAGASHLVNRKATALAYKLPAVIMSNVIPPAIHVGKQVMFFMPDIVLIQEGSRVGAVNYADLNARWQDSRFIETERLPSDAKIVGHTWKHPNKSGGPDRRFKDNRQIPICLYEAMHFTSNSGLNELIEFSRTGVAAAFVDGCRMLAALPRGRTSPALPPVPSNIAPASATDRKRTPLRTAMLTTLGMFIGLPVLAIVFGASGREADTALPPMLAAGISASSPAGEKETAASRGMKSDALPQSEKLAVTAEPTSASANATDIPPRGSAGRLKSELATVRYTQTAVNLREGPGTKYGIVAAIPKGNAVSVSEVRGGWSSVQTEDNKRGWMANSTIGDRFPLQ